MTLVERVRPAAGEPEGALVLLHGAAPTRTTCTACSTSSIRPPAGRRDAARRRCRCRPAARTGTPSTASASPIRTRSGRRSSDLCAWYDALPERLGFPADRIVLGGFSQGCVMSYALGLQAGRPAPRALLAMSGFMPVVEGLELDLDRPGLEIVIEHGAADPVIGVGFAREARARLAGTPVNSATASSPAATGSIPARWHRCAPRSTPHSPEPGSLTRAGGPPPDQADTIPACAPSPPSSTRTCRARGRRPTRPRSRGLSAVTDRQRAALRALNIETVGDLLETLPFRFDDFTQVQPLVAARPGRRRHGAGHASRASPSGARRAATCGSSRPACPIPTAASRRCRGSTSATCCARSSPACCCWCGARCARRASARPRSR